MKYVEAPLRSLFYFKEGDQEMKTAKMYLVFAGALAAFGATGCSSSVAAKSYEAGTPVKVGLICLHDKDSTYDRNFIDALDSAVADLGSRVASKIVKTNVAESMDAYDAAKDLVKQGCNVIFADSFGHEEFVLKAAKEFPTVTFCHATGTQANVVEGVPNYHNAFASIYEGRYLA